MLVWEEESKVGLLSGEPFCPDCVGEIEKEEERKEDWKTDGVGGKKGGACVRERKTCPLESETSRLFCASGSVPTEARFLSAAVR